jgi:hypothetical protein
MNHQHQQSIDSLEYFEGAEDEGAEDYCVLAITDIGSSFIKVFVAVKEITGESTVGTKKVMESPIPIIIKYGSRMSLNSDAIRLEEAGAEAGIFLRKNK